MKVPIEIVFRHVEKTPELEGIIREKAAKLEQVCGYLSSCRVAVEKTNEHWQRGNPYRIRIDLTIPPSHELVVKHHFKPGHEHDSLAHMIRETFDAARLEVSEFVRRHRSRLGKPKNAAEDALQEL